MVLSGFQRTQFHRPLSPIWVISSIRCGIWSMLRCLWEVPLCTRAQWNGWALKWSAFLKHCPFVSRNTGSDTDVVRCEASDAILLYGICVNSIKYCSFNVWHVGWLTGRPIQLVKKLPPAFGHDCLRSLVVSLIHSRLDYGNFILVGLPAYLQWHLQSVLNAAARLVFRLRRYDPFTDAFATLHWLRLPERVDFKVAVMAFHVLHGLAP